MSTEDRLLRLGLSHLADRPAELAKALERQVQESERYEEEVIEAELEAIRAKLGIKVVPDADAPAGRPATGLRRRKS